MESKGSFAAQLILGTASRFAAGTVARQQEAGEIENGSPFPDLVADTEVRLRYLAAALAAGRDQILTDHLAWHKVALLSRGVAVDSLAHNLERMREELLESLPDEAAAAASATIGAGLQSLATAPESAPSVLESDEPGVEDARHYLLAVLEANRAAAFAVIDRALQAGRSVAEIHDAIILPVQRELGRMWQMDEIHIAEEHFGSRITEDVLARLRQRIPEPSEDGPRVLTTTVEGNFHSIGVEIVGDRFAIAGWRVLPLGVSVPANDLARALIDFDAHLLVLSVHLGIHVPAAESLISALRARPDCGHLPILVGGPPFASIPDLWKVVGANASAPDAGTAVQAGERLVSA
jgi:methanogenic corrinoid protein MtbC1